MYVVCSFETSEPLLSDSSHTAEYTKRFDILGYHDGDHEDYLISGFRRDVDEICVLLGYYAASRGNPLPTTLEDGTDTLSRKVGKVITTRRCVISQNIADLMTNTFLKEFTHTICYKFTSV